MSKRERLMRHFAERLEDGFRMIEEDEPPCTLDDCDEMDNLDGTRDEFEDLVAQAVAESR